MRIALIGEGLVFAGAIEAARSRGHVVGGIRATAPAEAAILARAGLPVSHAPVPAWVEHCACDLLLSINNLHIVDAATLARPGLTAINYHNAPLPAYAGLRATTWAIVNGESRHGITWHRMEPGIDTGAILVQRQFAIDADDTTATLNARCTAAALASLPELFDLIERGALAGHPQQHAGRSYYGRRDVVPNGGRIDWQWTAERILRLVRACDWASYPNDFGRVMVPGAKGVERVVRSARRADGKGAPGTVLNTVGDVVTLACSDGAVAFTLGQLQTPCNAPAPSLFMERAHFAPAQHPTVLASLAQQTEADPRGIAIREGHAAVSRDALSQRAHGLARILLGAGVRKEDGVGVLLPAGSDFVTAAWAVMLAGGAYVPLHLDAPSRRRAVEVDEARITHIVTSGEHAPALDGLAVQVILIDAGMEPSSSSRLPTVAADDCAYRIFTSGSTGRPKAVEVTHGALANLIAHYHAAIPLGPNDRMSMLAHPTFDASMADTWPILAAGGTLCVPPRHVLRDPQGLILWLAATHCTCAFVPTAIAERLLDMPWPADIALRNLLTGGEALHRHPPSGLPFRLTNTYGPTENTVDSLWKVVEPGEGRPAIGRPIAGVTAAVVDETGRALRDGGLGELVLGGAQVARGYCGRPQLSAEKFELDPVLPGARRYRTGDRVRVNVDGDFEFHGRIDQQVQLFGIRVEPGEIEALLNADARVLHALCVPEIIDDKAVGLLAHVVPAPGVLHDAMLADALRAMLTEHLPPAIVPRVIELHAEFPRTPAGKVDRAVFAARARRADPSDGSDPIKAAWRRALPRAAEESENTRFWDLGGDSLGAIDLLLTVEAATGVRLPVGHFLVTPTLAGLRALVAKGAPVTIVELHPGTGTPLLCWYGLTGDLEAYSRLAERMGKRRVLGILSPVVTIGAAMPADVAEAVARGLEALRAFGLDEVPVMVGYSWSGKLAFEAARQLTAAGTPPPFVALIGSLPPIRPRGNASRLLRVLRHGPKVALRRMFTAPPSPRRVFTALRRMAWMLGPKGAEPKTTSKRTPLMEAHAQLGYRYCPTDAMPLKVQLFRDIDSRDRVMDLGYFRLDLPHMGWGEWVEGDITVHWYPAHHDTLMKEPSVGKIAAILIDLGPGHRSG